MIKKIMSATFEFTMPQIMSATFEFKMREEINQSEESDRSDLFDQLNYCDCTSSVKELYHYDS